LTSNLKSGLTFNKVLLFNMGLKSIHGFIVKTLNTTQEKKKNNKNIQKQHFKKIFHAQSGMRDFGFFGG
jgi:hypothetical protein